MDRLERPTSIRDVCPHPAAGLLPALVVDNAARLLVHPVVRGSDGTVVQGGHLAGMRAGLSDVGAVYPDRDPLIECINACYRRVRGRTEDVTAIIAIARKLRAVIREFLRSRRVWEGFTTSGNLRARSRRPDAMGDRP